MVVEGDLLQKCSAGTLHNIAFDAALEPVGVDDQPAIMGDREFARPHLAATPVDLDLGDDRDHRARALRISDAAPAPDTAAAVGPRRRAIDFFELPLWQERRSRPVIRRPER